MKNIIISQVDLQRWDGVAVVNIRAQLSENAAIKAEAFLRELIQSDVDALELLQSAQQAQRAARAFGSFDGSVMIGVPADSDTEYN